ncbi:hypothetical protein [Rhodococcus qingshengii]|uniref:hypothetical protein n=1 Tax=Rhodococcus qingshengii TaxID=334542 RepID=UPI002109926E|nr:hypothetical protein [Rhodococcus qingshengii]MCQ4148580.1 hypothetical protein [Rhodococcus qingshengii]
MPKAAEKVTVDLKERTLFVDGVEFPWHISEEGPIFGPLLGPVREVTITLLAHDVEVIPQSN